MTREIKFRALSNHTNEWVYGNLVQDGNGNKYVVPFNYFELDGHHLACNSDVPVFIKDGTDGEFTGLKDKNWKEIYEGDIVTDGSLAGFGANIRYQATIEFKDGCWKQTNSNCDCGECTDAVLFENHKELEVIGNIYENLELLNKETGL